MIKLTANLISNEEVSFPKMREGVLYMNLLGMVYTRLQGDTILCLDNLTLSPLEEFSSNAELTPLNKGESITLTQE